MSPDDRASALLPIGRAPTSAPAGFAYGEAASAGRVVVSLGPSRRERVASWAFALGVMALVALGLGLAMSAAGIAYGLALSLVPLLVCGVLLARVALRLRPTRIELGARATITGVPLLRRATSAPLDAIERFAVEEKALPAAANPVPLGGPLVTRELRLLLTSGAAVRVSTPTDEPAHLAFLASRLDALVEHVRAERLDAEMCARANEGYRGAPPGAKVRIADDDALEDERPAGARASRAHPADE